MLVRCFFLSYRVGGFWGVIYLGCVGWRELYGGLVGWGIVIDKFYWGYTVMVVG